MARSNRQYRLIWRVPPSTISDNLDTRFEEVLDSWYGYANKFTKTGLGRSAGQYQEDLGSNGNAWTNRSGAASRSITLDIEQSKRKTGYRLADVFKFVAYHDMALFYSISVPYYQRRRDYLVYLRAKVGENYMQRYVEQRTKSFFDDIVGSWERK